MVTQTPPFLEVDPAAIGVLELDGIDVPYVDLEDAPFIHSRLRVRDAEYVYQRTYPIKGHSAIMPADVQALIAQGKRVLTGERGERYYLFAS